MRYQLRGGHVSVYVDSIAMSRKYHCERVSTEDGAAILRPYGIDEMRAGLPLTLGITTRLTLEFNLVGVNGLDFILKDGQVFPVEVNPRYSASMELIERAYGLSIFDLHVKSVLQGALPDFDLAGKLGDQIFFGKAIVYAEQDSAAPDTHGWLARDIRDVPFPGETLSAGDPVCTVLASGLTQAECFAGLVAQAEALKGEIYAR